MRMSRPSYSLRRLFSLSLLATALFLVGCGDSGSSEGTELPYAVGDSISSADIALLVSSEYGTDTLNASQYQRQVKMRTQKLSPDQRSTDTLQSIHRDFVRRFAGSHVMTGEAKNKDLSVSSDQIEKRLKQITQRYQSEEELKKRLAQNNMTMDSLRSYIADQLRTQTLQQQMAEQAEEPTDAEVEEYSKENRRIRAQHILLRAGKDAPQSKIDSARQAAAALIDSANAGIDFAELARRHSEGPSAEQGGDLGFFTRDQMVEPFSEAAFALADSGDVASEPVRTRFGFHVIRLTNEGEPMDSSKARQQMMQQRRKDTFDQELDKLLEKVTVRANPQFVQAGLHEN